MEAFRYGGRRLCHMLCLLFNACMKFGYIPSQLMDAVIVPLVKCKTGDLSEVDSYRAITMSNSISKVLEFLLLMGAALFYQARRQKNDVVTASRGSFEPICIS